MLKELKKTAQDILSGFLYKVTSLSTGQKTKPVAVRGVCSPRTLHFTSICQVN